MNQIKNLDINISTKEKIGYGFGDLACCLIYVSISSYLLFFYTDVFGITASVAAFMFFGSSYFGCYSRPCYRNSH